MFTHTSYIFILLSITAGLLTLLSSVGIFVSLIIQRRVERLQDILEELTDQSYQEDLNLSGKIYNLIEKYQMQYLLPDKPSKTIVNYMDLTISVVITFWAATLVLSYQPPWHWQSLVSLFPMIVAFVLMFFFRQLLKNAINPLNNQLLNAIIPPPVKLRSVSFLSHYVNVSVKSILKQARLNLVVRKQSSLKADCDTLGAVVLKEELSFDDFLYYCRLHTGNHNLFLGFGQIAITFPKDDITNKPVPIQRNVNIPLGRTYWHILPHKDFLSVQLLVFPRGEKYPIEYNFDLREENDYFVSWEEPMARINRSIIYQVTEQGKVILRDGLDEAPYLKHIQDSLAFDGKRRFVVNPGAELEPDEVKHCDETVFVH
ncbi:hypothetical protein MFMK1_003288 [Metallumcola ferriviriculae]|uniref:Uncharacterized protein n=1 Tax=Metallumcola ferriviriculae TaxID=3039180 RepID=A0AAU0UVS8_9FIRM|nr:hypothetical protein MFMK1_003288 [Desulfitibacteraceae bacterium MK1]